MTTINFMKAMARHDDDGRGLSTEMSLMRVIYQHQ